MKRYIILFMALLVVGYVSASDAATVSFEVDFWTDGSNPVYNYTKDGPGDLGDQILLEIGDSINVDIFFSTDMTISAGSWNLQYDPAILSVSSVEGAGPPWVLPTVDLSTPGSVLYQDAVFPPYVGPGDNFFFGLANFEITEFGSTDLILDDYLGFFTDSGDPIAIDPSINLGTILTPLPGTIWILGAALLGLLGISRRK